MANKNSALVQKISVLVKLYLLLAKLKKPVIRKLASLMKMKKMKLLQHYSSHYSYVKEYEFSPSSTPLIQFRRMSKSGKLRLKKLYSDALLIFTCFLGCRKKEMYRLEMGEGYAGEIIAESSSWSSCSDDDSVDERAERFIQKFYEEMRRQRNDASSQLLLQN